VSRADAEALRAIHRGEALAARVENDLEERGLIVQSDAPYATLTRAGLALLEARPTAAECASRAATARERWQAAIDPGERAYHRRAHFAWAQMAEEIGQDEWCAWAKAARDREVSPFVGWSA
jgi:hypothetical protein